MHLSISEFLELERPELEAFLNRCVPEGPQIDYKATIGPLPLSGDVKSEFMKDVTAFANADGGILVYGYEEPDEITSTVGEFRGVENGQEVAAVLERVAQDRADPRIPQFMIKSILVSNNLSAIVCYVRSSEIKPHMCGGKFYMRHSESSSPMNAAEVRQSVISAYSRNTEIANILDSKEAEQSKYVLRETPGFILQAIPLIELTSNWDVQSESFKAVVRGHARYQVHEEYSLNCNAAPYPGIQCIRGNENRNADSKWYLEIATSGHISVVYRNFLITNQQIPYLVSDTIYLFRAFGRLVDESLAAGNTADTRMLLRAKYINASHTVFYRRIGNPNEAYGPVPSETIVFPEIVVDFDQDAKDVSMEYSDMLFHAFGITPNPRELPQSEE